MAWSFYTPKNGMSSWVLGDTFEFLNSPSHQIRLLATDTIVLMYEHAAPPTHTLLLDTPSGMQVGPPHATGPGEKRLEYYERTYAVLQKTFSIPATLSPSAYELKTSSLG
jgi:hypothetical protein